MEVGRGMEGVRGGGGVKQGVKIEDKSYSLFYAFSFFGGSEGNYGEMWRRME